ncbi:sugar ABC transporter substrate-binding protein [Anaeromicrobium sediminis]|nr:sugar ABC transporter substrate-binding protein [Anaeromicrobium sediminis]
MKKLKKIMALMLVIAMMVTLVVGCGAKETQTQETSNDVEKKSKIGVVVKALDSEHWLTVKKGAEDAAAETGVDVVVLAPDKESNVEQQFRIIEDLIQQKVDALAVAPCDSEGIVPFIEEANSNGIPVLTVDTNADANVVAFVGTNNTLGGKMAGERIVEIIGGEGKVALITGVPGQQTHRDRNAGFKEALKGTNIELVAEQPANSESALAMTVMENILQSNPDLKAVFCTNALMGLGAMEAIDAKGKLGDIKIIAFDTQTDVLNAIKDGKMDSVVAQSPYNMGYEAVKNAVKHINEEDVPKVVDTGTDLITEENVNEYLK